MKNLSDLSLVIPAKEEPNSLPKVLEELNEYDCQKIIVIEKQDTKTYESIKNFNCKIIYQSNKGYGNAIREGINNVKTEYLSIFYICLLCHCLKQNVANCFLSPYWIRFHPSYFYWKIF